MRGTLSAVVVVYPTWYTDKRSGMRKNYIALRGVDGDYYYDDDSEVRRWKGEGYAIRWLISIATRHGYRYQITKLDGSVISSETTLEDMCRHTWEKTNAVTLLSEVEGPYDVWRCRLCGRKVKKYGLAGRPY